jgi:hypothetical protein
VTEKIRDETARNVVAKIMEGRKVPSNVQGFLGGVFESGEEEVERALAT